MLNIHGWEFFLILIAALLLLGPDKLPDFAKWIGKALREVRNTTQEVREAIDFEMEKAELEKLKSEFQEEIEKETHSIRNQLDPFAEVSEKKLPEAQEKKELTSPENHSIPQGTQNK